MQTILIEEDFYNFLRGKAIPYEDKTVLDTIKRLVGFTSRQTHEKRAIRSGPKGEKTNLNELISAGLLREGEVLILRDYQGHPHSEYRATLSGGRLVYEDGSYSMSELARQLLRHLGFQSNSVRGPVHWSTESGKLVKELWDNYLKHPDRVKLL